MAKKEYDDKFIVINKKHFENVPGKEKESFYYGLQSIKPWVPHNKYIVCNQDEPYANLVLNLILSEDLYSKNSRKIFEEIFDVPDFLHFDGEDYMYYGEDPLLKEEQQDLSSKWTGFKYGYGLNNAYV